MNSIEYDLCLSYSDILLRMSLYIFRLDVKNRNRLGIQSPSISLKRLVNAPRHAWVLAR